MARNNFTFVRGTLVQEPYFNRVPDGPKGGQIAFLRFHVRAFRDATQPSVFPYDSVRVVSYGALAERAYPLLRSGNRVHVVGWLQYRSQRRILEVVADEIRTEEIQSIADQDVLQQLQQAASMLSMDVSSIIESLLKPQLSAILQGNHPLIEQLNGQGNGDGAG
jgi:single-stranded DNA-binding protein